MEASGARVAIFLPSLTAGGVGRSFVELANGFVRRGARVDFLLARASGPHLAQLDAAVRVVELAPASGLTTRRLVLRAHRGPRRALLRPFLLAAKDAPSCSALASLARYLARHDPDVLLAGKTHANLTALWARELAGVGTRVVVSERTHLSQQIAGKRAWRWRHVAPVVRRTYPLADAITSVSDGVADDLAETAGLARSRITTLYNPIPTETIRKQAAEPAGHPWLEDPRLRVILGAGRLVPQKDFGTLVEAFARLAPRRSELRLVILGEGKARAALEQRVRRLRLADRVSLPGYVQNPWAAMGRASAFVLSSIWEGLPAALLEALACGCPVVSTDCPSGPYEILEGGWLGELVPVGDPAAMAAAVERALEDPPAPARLTARAERFAAEAAVDGYLRILLETEEAAPA